MATGERRAAGATLRAAVLLMLVLAATVHADPIGVVNVLRMEGCGGRPAAGAPVAPDSRLDRVARQLARADSLEAALDLAGYPAMSATSFHVRGSREDAVIRNLLGSRYCESLNDPRYEEAGVFSARDETWIVLAVRQPSQPSLDRATTVARVLELVNAARAEARACGDERYDAAPALTLSPMLNAAALLQASDMAVRGVASHEGADGSAVGDRITRSGYAWKASGENVAAGQRDAEAVVRAWLSSPGHCATLMAPYFTETGIAFALAPTKNPSIYWTQVFATAQTAADAGAQ